jgi:5-methylcytosine-specific restriction endonuclease McrA
VLFKKVTFSTGSLEHQTSRRKIMERYADSLWGYGHNTHVRYNFTCQYCGYDGRAFPNWFQLTFDHIVPRSLNGPDTDENKGTVCQACNSITSRMKFDRDLTKEQILEAKRARVRDRMADYFKFWREEVAPLYLKAWD